MTRAAVQEKAVECLEAATALTTAANEKELGGDKLLWAVGTAITMAIVGLAYAVLAESERP